MPPLPVGPCYCGGWQIITSIAHFQSARSGALLPGLAFSLFERAPNALGQGVDSYVTPPEARGGWPPRGAHEIKASLRHPDSLSLSECTMMT